MGYPTLAVLKALSITDIGSANNERLRDIRLCLETAPSKINQGLISGINAYCEYRLGNYNKAHSYSSTIDPDFFLGPEGEAYFPYFGKRLLQEGNSARLSAIINSLPSSYLIYDYRNIFPEVEAPTKSPDRLRVLINAIPKSASVSLNSLIASGLRALACLAPVNQFPDSKIDDSFLIRFQRWDEVFFYGHLDATQENKSAYLKHFDKIILHVRDPRQVISSWLSFIEAETLRSGPYLYLVPDNYLNLSQSEKRELVIKKHLPKFVHWLESWKQAKEDLGEQLLIVNYEDFVLNPESYLTRICSFLGMEDKTETMINLNTRLKSHAQKSEELHYREGRTNSWKERFDDREKLTFQELIPNSLLQFFNWSK